MRHHRNPIALAALTAVAALAMAPSIVAANSASYESRDLPPRTASALPPIAAASGSPIHFGGGTAADTALALDVAHALAMEPRLSGATMTVAANRGDVMLSGSAQSTEQADHAQRAAQKVAGVARVSGTLSPMAG